MNELLVQLGYFGLFIVSFISATVIPAATEAFMMGMRALGYSLVGMLIFATAGNVLGALFNYSIGWRGLAVLERSRFAPKPETIHRIQHLFKRWGGLILLLSWLPFVGDPMTVVAGLIRVPLRMFMPLVFIGRLLRYVAILALGETAFRFFA